MKHREKQTISSMVISTSNDYSRVEGDFIKKTGLNLIKLDRRAIKFAKDPISIVIPTYIGERLDIILQNLNNQVYKNFEVIIVDDASPNDVTTKFKNSIFSFPIKYIRVLKNQGASTATNIGVDLSNSNIIILMEQDMIPPIDLTAKMAVRQQFTTKSVFVGFRETIRYEDYVRRHKPASMSGDWRYKIKDDGSFLDLTIKQTFKSIIKGKINLLKKSDYFKKFGMGETISHWDLASMVIGHSLCFKKDDIVEAGGFIERFFYGWGMDDIALGASMIANKNFIIPAVDWVSYHIEHDRYSGSRAIEMAELKKNLDLYLNKYIAYSNNKLKFRHHKIKKIKSVNNITYYESY
ncbi:MAG: glycosyltransferase family 2 protein [Candidatus Paceibacterota bacterium]